MVDVLTEAFFDDPIALFPDEGERPRLQSLLYDLLLTHPAAEPYLTGREGAAVWLTPGPDPESPDLAAFGASSERMIALGAALAERHPDGAHLYLYCIGVVGARQGAGLGSAFLHHQLERAPGLDLYLEASSPRSRDLYLRHGFEDFGEPVRVDDSPPAWPMLRPAAERR